MILCRRQLEKSQVGDPISTSGDHFGQHQQVNHSLEQADQF